MLSDEEKKAIETIKDFKNLKWYEHAFDNGTEVLDEEQKQDINVLLNLIEKQSKEIEELKAISEYREKIIKGLGLKTLPKTITGFRELIENNDKKWEDKIKAKIEEVKDGTYDAKIVLQSLLEKE